ncbi:hypothetical protein ACU4GA_28370 [Methylobacterium oryzae CBMB20]
MLILALLIALLAVVVAMFVLRRWTGRLASLATLLAGAIMVLWLAEVGIAARYRGAADAVSPRRPRTRPVTVR